MRLKVGKRARCYEGVADGGVGDMDDVEEVLEDVLLLHAQ